VDARSGTQVPVKSPRGKPAPSSTPGSTWAGTLAFTGAGPECCFWACRGSSGHADNIDYVSIEWHQQRCERSVHLFPHLLLSALAPLLPEKHSGPRRRNVTGAFGADVATSLEGLESLGRGAEMRHHRPPDTARPPWGKDPHHLPRVHHGAFVIRRLSMVALWHRKTLCVL